MIYHLGCVDASIQSGVLVIPKITFINLCKPVHIFIIVSVLSDPLNLENLEGKEKKLIKK